jgi:hypothetical protein
MGADLHQLFSCMRDAIRWHHSRLLTAAGSTYPAINRYDDSKYHAKTGVMDSL